VTDEQTDRQTDRITTPKLDHASIAASRGKNGSLDAVGPLSVLSVCNVGVLWPNDWMDQDTTWPSHIMLDGSLAPPTERGTVAPTFWPMSIVAKGSPMSVTAELLFPII